MKKDTSTSHKKKRRLNKKRVFKILLIIILIISSICYYNELKIKRIIINGANITKEYKIINAAGIREYPKISNINIDDAKKNITNLPLIEDVDIKINLLGHFKINIKEAKPLYYYKNEIMTSSNKIIENQYYEFGLPTLLNDVEEDIIPLLNEAMVKLKTNILQSINEIEYTPSLSINGVTINKYRFTFKMNDGNIAVVDTINIEKLNNYLEILNTTIHTYGNDTKGQFDFDSASNTVTFLPFDKVKEKEEVVKESDNNE